MLWVPDSVTEQLGGAVEGLVCMDRLEVDADSIEILITSRGQS